MGGRTGHIPDRLDRGIPETAVGVLCADTAVTPFLAFSLLWRRRGVNLQVFWTFSNFFILCGMSESGVVRGLAEHGGGG